MLFTIKKYSAVFYNTANLTWLLFYFKTMLR